MQALLQKVFNIITYYDDRQRQEMCIYELPIYGFTGWVDTLTGWKVDKDGG